MYCPVCGATIFHGQQFCGVCGRPIGGVNPVYAPNPYLDERSLPPRYRPLSAWAYFGYSLLFAIPIVGFILLIIYSFSDDNINRRNFARSFWCGLLIAAIIWVIALIFAAIFGISTYY